ncbi:MAG: hypothetical protein U0521_17800 [Anaerolineae bacterium]
MATSRSLQNPYLRVAPPLVAVVTAVLLTIFLEPVRSGWSRLWRWCSCWCGGHPRTAAGVVEQRATGQAARRRAPNSTLRWWTNIQGMAEALVYGRAAQGLRACAL